ncbi:hypothetical protein ANO14919_034560 [Xylariales sp. No.14919]|nr:hypothetical protein ANO14919_034560 [Xylariales sp. No.14919]
MGRPEGRQCLIAPAMIQDAPFATDGTPEFWGRETSQAANIELSRHCLETCVSTHKHCHWQTRDSDQASKLRNFRLIGCSLDTPVVEIHSLTERYPALSHALGKFRAGTSETAATRTKMILDAITMTRKPGLRYPWVDEYCINHDETAEKLWQGQ